MNFQNKHNVTIKGSGSKTIIFAHGYGCDQNMWRHITPAFEKDHKVILFDYIGHGQSSAKNYDLEKYSSLNGFAEDLIEICHELELQDVIFVGHSVSAIIGILASLKDRDIFGKLVLVSPSPRYINENGYVGGFAEADIQELLDFLDSNHLGWSSTMAPTIMGNPERPELGRELENSFCRTDPLVAKHFARVTFLSDNREELQHVDLPTLILQCGDDAIAQRRWEFS